MKHLIGQGILNWNRSERVSDRYGLVMLTRAPMESPIGDDLGYSSIETNEHIGKHGKLTAIVRINRESPHIGDILRGLRPPRTPVATGRELLLGEGTFFTEVNAEGGTCVGLRPDDGRDSDWLNPRVLYQLHNQTVDLFFEDERK